MASHRLKVWAEYFNDLYSGAKNFEVRKNDRDFKIGDNLLLSQYDKDRKDYVYLGKGEEKMINHCHREITYVLQGGQFGIEEGYVVLGLK